MYVMLALEEEFGIEFTDDEIADLASVSDLMNAMTAKTGAALSWQ
jgi:acyl carrier protein